MMVVICFALYVFSMVIGPFLADSWLFKNSDENNSLYMILLRWIFTIVLSVGLFLLGVRLVKVVYDVYKKLRRKK